jgi:photosynthetic reaction center cytochrome c subunit
MKIGNLMHQRVQRWIRHTLFGMFVVGLFVSVGLLLTLQGDTQTVAQQPPELQPAEKVFKNIQVLNGMPAADLQGAMSFIASSLNVDCDYCHRQAFEGDTVPAKLRAREMILMVRKINQENFQGQNVVNCFTCHKGSAKPVSGATTVQSRAPRPAALAQSAQAESLPSVQEILDHYVQALGGQAALDRVKTRAFKTVGLKEQNPSTPTEWYQESPNKVLQLRSSQGYTSWVAFNGQHAWAQDNEKSYWGMLNTPERNQIMRDSEMYPGSRLRSQYQNVATIGKEQVGGHDTYVVAGISPEGVHEQFYFDTQTGLLLRRDIQDQSIFGFLPVQADYDDYRDVDGVKIPFIVQWSSAGGAWGIRTSSKIVKIHQNVDIDSEKFDHPVPGK